MNKKIEKPTSVLEVSPFFHEGSTETFLKTSDQSPDALNRRMNITPFGQQKETPMKSHSASTIDLQDSKNTIQLRVNLFDPLPGDLGRSQRECLPVKNLEEVSWS